MFWYYIIALIIIGIDQITKWIVITSMELGERISMVEGFFYLTSHRNQGAAWGILQGKMGFFYVVTVIVVIGVIYYMQKYARNDKWLALGLSFILGGAIGNFIDRLFRQEVVDFFDFYILNYNFPIFNVADSALTIGVILFIIATILDELKKGKSKS
ncbi:signal peptidase II [Oceanobacillus halophilus]|uniref:Lipoprotein signal peptidase n=1 Tax=Oceanobacillus halophilus TaxID=930130 RepID=A0A495AC52_9BACI|nr:signal peptidase II [Oceanobacillus halophilus]RKQ37413.1 lipoprotein signal peptidase [Oceanobacillus halophilus]